MKNEIEIIEKEERLIVRFYGEVDNLVVTNYRERLSHLIEENKYTIVIMNFDKVGFIDSSGIGMVLGRYNQINKYGGRLFITKLSPVAYRIFDLTGIFKIIDYIEEEENYSKVGKQYESNGFKI